MTVNRRKVLSGIVSGSITAMTTPIGQGAPLDDNTKRITTVRQGQESIKEKEVPKSWWRQLVHTRNVRRTLEENYLNQEAVKYISLGSSSSDLEDRDRPSVTVVVDFSNTTPTLPDTVEGVPVSIKEWVPPEPDACNTNCTEYNPVPGGVRVENNDYPSYEPATSCCPARDSANNAGLITCAHFYSCFDGKVKGKNLLQGNSSPKIVGEVTEFSWGDDFVFADSTKSVSEVNIRDDINFSGRNVRGYVTKNALADMMSTSGNDNVKKFGINTGLDTGGNIEQIKKSKPLCDEQGDHFVEIDLATGNGDSGGPYFKTYFDENTNQYYDAVIATHYGNESDGSAAYNIANTYNIQFGL
ncbi:hypothetical protein [Haloarchaeobius sp. FL176]|uniref:hypothetical protein n=1 Tax=Haloarchaeobius sp. FL176 TaxID=2967129 RepID=UPI0021476CCA|nr:hypothetical protein [Haloarchaeobius sp. FL176]